MRTMLSVLALLLPLRAEDLVAAIARFDPAAAPKGKAERDLEADALRRAEARYGPHAKDHLPQLIAEVTMNWRRAQLAERCAANVAGVESAGAPDHGTATQFLCEVFVACDARSAALEKQRDELAQQIAKQGGAGDGKGPLSVERQMLREYADHLVSLRTSCLTLLSGKQAEDSIRYLLATALPRAPSPLLRVNVARILAPRPKVTVGAYLALAAKEPDEGVRAGIATALGMMGERAAEEVPRIAGLLADPSDRVRVAVARALSVIRTPEAVEPLVMAIAKESGAPLYEFARALEWLTGERHGIHADVWARWWEEHKGKILNEGLPPIGGPKAGGNAERWKAEGGFYYGIPQISQKVLYIVDISDSMRHEVEGKTRLERCQEEIARAITALPRSATFGILAFSAEVRPWRTEMSKATDANKEVAKEWIAELRLGSSTNIHDALRDAFQMAGTGATKKGSKALIDTIYLLSDGAPTRADATLDDANLILAAVREWNSLGRITIHCIGIGEGLKFSFLEQLAQEHQGTFVQKSW